ncbi:TetR/AcrR family transcriptional regulator [Streptomyces sp. WMMC940]|uniref:TetR/AcrR family transcriptional regulator n=1 Tax=Streptomyces sp. WMMC940 TaxID=3015153 RepID=UPI0022B70FE3|nr:TetR/AcrR family transcriptional regulator [Streptomyces sp. WMMC940]MCZ7461882.1 TetR/AcrR family transcriptional regulator [Streptomyces sp. WMMC940]
MARLTRVQTQQRTRADVLAAARDEFAENGFRAARIDAIAERAGLTRGAVYSNFPGKRALYFSVLAELAERAPSTTGPAPQQGRTAAEALGALARAWVTRPASAGAERGGRDRVGAGPTGGARPGAAGLGADLVPEVTADEGLRRSYRQLLEVDALLVALALEALRPLAPVPGAPPRRSVRLAKTVLATLHGASRTAAAAPGFIEPFDVVSACEQLAGLELSDWWAPPTGIRPAARADDPWRPPAAADLVTCEPVRLTSDGVVALLGMHRLSAVEEAVRAAPPGTGITLVAVTGEPDELVPLSRLVVGELSRCLREAFPRSAWPGLEVLCDGSGEVAAAAGITRVGDTTEAAVRVGGGRIVYRATGPGACHAVASAAVSHAGPAPAAC